MRLLLIVEYFHKFLSTFSLVLTMLPLMVIFFKTSARLRLLDSTLLFHASSGPPYFNSHLSPCTY
jgi:heme A synthase